MHVLQIWAKLTGWVTPSLYFIFNIKIVSFIAHTHTHTHIRSAHSLLEGYQSLPWQWAKNDPSSLEYFGQIALEPFGEGTTGLGEEGVDIFVFSLCLFFEDLTPPSAPSVSNDVNEARDGEPRVTVSGFSEHRHGAWTAQRSRWTCRPFRRDGGRDLWMGHREGVQGWLEIVRSPKCRKIWF